MSPAPNIYWQGSPSEFLQLLNDLHSLGVTSGASIELGHLTYINLVHISSYKIISKMNGAILINVSNGEVVSELDPSAWKHFLHKILALSFGHGFIYQDIEALSLSTLAENANIIMSSKNGTPKKKEP